MANWKKKITKNIIKNSTDANGNKIKNKNVNEALRLIKEKRKDR